MRIRTATWFEAVVSYERQAEEGNLKKVTETYVVDALTFGEAEEAITKEVAPFANGEFNVKNITPATYAEVVFSDSENADKWYKAKACFVVLDEKSGKEKRSNVLFLVQSESFNGAVKTMDDYLNQGVGVSMLVNVTETKIMDVFEHDAPQKAEERNDKPEYEEADQQKKEEK